MGELLTADEVAAILKASRDYVYAVKHKIGFVRFGRSVRFRRDALEAFIRAHQEGTPEAIARISVRALAGEG